MAFSIFHITHKLVTREAGLANVGIVTKRVFERVNVCGTKILVWGKEVKDEVVQAGANNPSMAEPFSFPFCHSKLVHKRSLVHTHIIQFPDHAFMVNNSV